MKFGIELRSPKVSAGTERHGTLFNLEGTRVLWMEKYGGLAQLGERLPCKQEVSGSIPLISTTLLLVQLSNQCNV